MASLYIAMVNGETPIGNDWRTVYVPGGATELYSQLTQNEVKEMYTCEAIPSQGSVTLTPTPTNNGSPSTASASTPPQPPRVSTSAGAEAKPRSA